MFLFSVEKARNEIIQFSSGISFLLNLPMSRRTVGVLYNTYVWGVTTVRKPKLTDWNPAVGRIFKIFLDNR